MQQPNIIPGDVMNYPNEEIQQPQDNSDNQFNPWYNPQVQEERIASFLEQTSPFKTLERINNVLKGMAFDSQKRDWVKVSDPIPEKIRNDFIQMLTVHLSEDARMTRLDKLQINGIMNSIIEWVADYLYLNADAYDIEGKLIYKLESEQLTKIGFMMIAAVFYTILRSQDGVERGKLFSSLDLKGSINPGVPQESKLESWKFWK